MFRALGMASISARDKTSGCATFSTSTVASKASTVTVSPTEPTFISASTGTDTFAGTVTCCLTVLNPSRLKVITYRPGRTSTIVYRPDSLVVTMRDPSITAASWIYAPNSTLATLAGQIEGLVRLGGVAAVDPASGG